MDYSSWLSRPRRASAVRKLFGVTCAAAAANRNNSKIMAGIITTILAMSCFAGFLALGATIDYRILFAAGIAFAMLLVVQLEMEGHLVAPLWFVFLGNASYAIYLIHNPLVSLTSRLATRVPGFDTWQGAMVLGITASIVAGCLYHVLVERPGLKIIRDALKKPRRASV